MRTVISEATLEADFGGVARRRWRGPPGMEPGGAGAQGPLGARAAFRGHAHWLRWPPSPLLLWTLGLLVLPSPAHPQAPTGGPARSSQSGFLMSTQGSKSAHSPGQALCPHHSSQASEKCINHPTETGSRQEGEGWLLSQSLGET